MNGYVDSFQSLFDELWYRTKYHDIVGDAFSFFCSIGWQRGDDPSSLFLTTWYQKLYPDVAPYGINPLEHFANSGLGEGRTPNPLFDPHWYNSQARLPPGTALWNHYCTTGWLLGYTPHPLFNAEYYLSTNPDVQAAAMNPLIHYLTNGHVEGRKPSPLFDGPWYTKAYPAALKTTGGPLVDFLTYGAGIGRNPSPHFDVADYRLRNMRLEDGTQNPLVHRMLTIELAEPPSAAAVRV